MGASLLVLGFCVIALALSLWGPGLTGGLGCQPGLPIKSLISPMFFLAGAWIVRYFTEGINWQGVGEKILVAITFIVTGLSIWNLLACPPG